MHDEQLAEHGGLTRLRDANAVESAVACAEQLAHCGTPDPADLAAAVGFGMARKHSFLDGKKRSAFVAVELFLSLNNLELNASDANCVVTVLGVAAGDIPEADFAQLIRTHTMAL